MYKQLSLWPTEPISVDLASYDCIVVAFSGGKDSLACLLHLLDKEVDRQKLEIWHHCVDGNGADVNHFMDWPVTTSYVQAVARAFRIPCFLSWKQGGFLCEMLRQNSPTSATHFETPDGLQSAGGNSKKINTRLKFPQVSGDLSVRWCSAYLKIGVAAIALRNQQRFLGKKTLFVTGERADESPNRAKYNQLEPHQADTRNSRTVYRYIDHWRAVLHWNRQDVWEIIRRYGINPHPAYRLGWGRVSCFGCIFGSANMWASVRLIAPDYFARINKYERKFGHTIQHNESIVELANKGKPFTMQGADISSALANKFNEPILLPADSWHLPAGAYGESDGSP